MVTKKQNQDPVAAQIVSKEAKSARDEAASIIASMANVSPEARVELQRMGLSMPALNGEGKIVVRWTVAVAVLLRSEILPEVLLVALT